MERNWPFFIILIDFLYLQESVAHRKKIEEEFHSLKSSNEVRVFELKLELVPQMNKIEKWGGKFCCFFGISIQKCSRLLRFRRYEFFF